MFILVLDIGVCVLSYGFTDSVLSRHGKSVSQQEAASAFDVQPGETREEKGEGT